MGTGYTRQSAANIVTGLVVEAAPLNAEFNALVDVFNSSTGHSHDGTTGEGPKIALNTSLAGVLPVAHGGINAIHKIDGTTAPTADDDSADGYGPGSLWIDTTNDVAYICLDATVATAVWQRYQPYDTDLAAMAALDTTDGNFIVGNGSAWIVESGATARTSLGLGSLATLSTINNSNWSGTDLAITNGGTGASTVVGARSNLNFTKGSDIASASSLTLGSDGDYFDVTGTTAITSIASVGVGSRALLQFDDALVLTHHATDLILPGETDITTAAGDHAEFVEYASGDWRCVSYTKASGQGITFSPFTPAEDDRIINGAFEIAQRGVSTSSDGYGGPDRWINGVIGGTVTHSQVALTVGDTIGSNTVRYASRQAVSGQSAAGDYAARAQRIEGVHSYAGQTITILGWARRISGSGNMVVEGTQVFGTGGSPSSAVTGIDPTTVVLSTLWAPFAVTMTIPSIAGKTLGSNADDYFAPLFWASAGSDWNARTNSLGIQTVTIDLWGIHIRKGVVPVEAAAFYTPPTAARALRECKRYYQKVGAGARGIWVSTYHLRVVQDLSVDMRAVPSAALLTSTPGVEKWSQSSATGSGSSISSNTSGPQRLEVQIDGFSTAYAYGDPAYLQTDVIGLSAEL